MAEPLSEQWIAWDNEHQPQRAWRLQAGQSVGPMETVNGAEDVLKMAAGLRILSFAQAAEPAVAVPAKPEARPILPPLTRAPNVLRVAALSQARPFGQLTGTACKVEGFLSLNRDWDGVICLPGFETSHWVQLSAGEVISFLSFATTPIVHALMTKADEAPQDPDPAALTDTLQDVMSKPESLALRCAEARAARQAGKLSEAEAHGRLWGAALGAELAAARPYWLGQSVALIAPTALTAPYLTALKSQFVPVTETDEARMTVAGFAQAIARA